MPIADTDILVKLSVDAVNGNTDAGTPNDSLGGAISTTEMGSTLHDLFDAVTGDENAASESEYRCVFLHNAHATLTAINVRVYILSEVAGGANLAIGVDPTAASVIGAAAPQAVTIADEDTAPAGVVFAAPTTLETAEVIGDLDPGECRALWIRRTAANTTAVANDGGTFRIVCESL